MLHTKTKPTAVAVCTKTRQVKPAGNRNTAIRVPGWAPLGVILLTAFVYNQAALNDLTKLDDAYYIVNNPHIRDFSWGGISTIFTSFYACNYHPFTSLCYLFMYRLFGLNPMPYHLLSVVLHLLNTWLVYRLAERLSGSGITALTVSLLFAIHPMHVESVAWAAELKDVLYAAFYLMSLLFYLQYLRSYRARYFAGMCLLFIASAFSKSAAVTLPVMLIAIDAYTGRAVNLRSVAEKIPLLLVSFFFGVLNIMAQSEAGSLNSIRISFGFINHIFLFTSAICLYITRLVFPFHLSAMHYYPVTTDGVLPWAYYVSLPFLLLVSFIVFRPSPFRKEIIFGVSFFYDQYFFNAAGNSCR